MLAVIIVYGLLCMGLAVGIWRSAGRSWSLRFVAVGLIVTGAIGLVLHPFFPMSSRGLEGDFTFRNAMHQNLTMVWALIISVTVVLAAFAYRGWFRFYSLATLVLLIAGGIAASIAIQALTRTTRPGREHSSGSTPTH
jgi:magnesium-transporting ATPase (P-type)